MSTPSPSFPPYPHSPDESEMVAASRRLVIWWLTGVSLVVLAAVSCALLSPSQQRTTPWEQLSFGQCVDDATAGAEALAKGDGPDGLHVVPCFEAHDGNIYATSRVPDDMASDPAAARQYTLEFCNHHQKAPIDNDLWAWFGPNADDLANG